MKLSERIGQAVGEYGVLVAGGNANLAPTVEWAGKWKALMAEVDALDAPRTFGGDDESSKRAT